MNKAVVALAGSLVLAVGGGMAPGVRAASLHASSTNREIIKLDAMNGSKNVATAVIVYDHKKNLTTVTLTVSRLQPKSTHPAAIHLGRCNSFKGPIVHGLPTLHADNKGHATVTASFHGAVSHDKWYVAIHEGPTLKTKRGAAMVACGDIS